MRRTLISRWLCALLVVLGAGLTLAAPDVPAPDGPPRAARLLVEGGIGPATAEYFVGALDEAAAAGADFVLVRMDTPGGLDTAMRTMIKAILAAPLPVVTWVAPGGARAASAGTYLLYASHIAAMAPGTNLGAATPVSIGGGGGLPGMGEDETSGDESRGGTPDKSRDEPRERPATADDDGAADSADGADPATAPAGGDAMERKAVNDAAAYIRSLAELRGRNADWAERAVREAVSLSAAEALDQNVIDVVAASETELFAAIDGLQVQVDEQTRPLRSAGATVEEIAPDWRHRLLAIITNPSVTYLLMMLGIYGLMFEFWNPGAIIPGVVGAISLLVAAYGLQLLPVNFAGLALILLGLGLMVAEAFAPSFGALGLGGAAAFAFGSVILIDTEAPGFGVPLGLVAGVTLAALAFTVWVTGALLRFRRTAAAGGGDSLLGEQAVAQDDFTGSGWVRVHGESWRALCAVPVRGGQVLRITGRDGLTLSVEPAHESPPSAQGEMQ